MASSERRAKSSAPAGGGEPRQRGRAAGWRAPRGSLDGLVASREIVIACGPGGVGKTTTAAAIAAMAACHHGGRVLVVTVDPAKRLADALGLSGIGNTETRIPDSVFEAAGFTPRGELWAAMLDMKESWDALVRRHAPDAETREQILANPLYKTISGRFVQSQDYMAMERLYEIHSEGKYDLIVVDTPPTRNALDFLDAPQRMADFFSSRLLRWLIVPYRSKLINFASKPFYQVADRILGTQFLADISEFFILFQSMYDGFVARAETVTRLLSDRRTKRSSSRPSWSGATSTWAQSCSTRCCPPISARRRTSQWRKPWPSAPRTSSSAWTWTGPWPHGCSPMWPRAS
jgi:anion-transporting  ArsA/GET3 family ATPase